MFFKFTSLQFTRSSAAPPPAPTAAAPPSCERSAAASEATLLAVDVFGGVLVGAVVVVAFDVEDGDDLGAAGREVDAIGDAGVFTAGV
jgi:hypothetical protein